MKPWMIFLGLIGVAALVFTMLALQATPPSRSPTDSADSTASESQQTPSTDEPDSADSASSDPPSSEDDPDGDNASDEDSTAQPGNGESDRPRSTANLDAVTCSGAADMAMPEPRMPELTVIEPCVELEGRVMFVSVLPSDDYIVKVWPTSQYNVLKTACLPSAEASSTELGRDFVVTIAKDDWSKFSSILQPEGKGGSYALTLSVRMRGVYVYSEITNRHVYQPHCEIHPLEGLESLETGSDDGS